MVRTKQLLLKNADKVVVLIILAGLVVINSVVPYKLGFLNFFYLPIIIAGYYMGKKTAVLTAVLSTLSVFMSYLISPKSFILMGSGNMIIWVSLLAWGSFLILTSAALGFLYEEKERKIGDLQQAYNGILEILTKYLEDTDKYTKGHSVRVADMSIEMAQAMGLSKNEIEIIRAAALLHDIGKIDIDLGILNKKGALTPSERRIMDSHAAKGAEILSLAGGMLKEAIPIVRAHHLFYRDDKNCSEGKIPLGACIIAIADSFDAMTSDRPYRQALPPRLALIEIERESGNQFNPEVVSIFKSMIINHLDQKPAEKNSEKEWPDTHRDQELREPRNSS
jgi:putative nucleotidyltransferase with HDIG domain